MRFFIKDNILKFFGYCLLIFGIFILVVGIGMLFDPDQKDRDTGPSIAVFSFAFTVPGIILLRLGKKAQREEEQIKAVATMIRSYRRIKLQTIAEKLGVTVLEAEKFLSRALSAKLIKGFIDRTTDEFVTKDARVKEIEVKFCSNCGAPLEEVYLEGETVKCRSCGSIIR